VFKETHEAGKMATLLKFKKKYTPERWKNDKQKLIEKYNELGYATHTS
jgi:outer membrane protein insertion porin family